MEVKIYYDAIIKVRLLMQGEDEGNVPTKQDLDDGIKELLNGEIGDGVQSFTVEIESEYLQSKGVM